MLLLLMASMGFAGSDTVGERNKTTEGEEVQYQLVTSDDEITTGRYLIVFTYNPNDGQALVFDGSLEALNGRNNTQQLQIENGVITTDKDIFFNINRVKGTVQSASGFYIGQTSSSNGLGQSVDTLYSHSFQMDDNGHAMICCEENGVFLGFYTRSPQRFLYGISSIQPIYLFKAVNEPNVRVTIDELGYETLYCGSYALAIPEGITASVVTNADADGNLQLENLWDCIPAATGVIIQGAPMEYEFPILPDCYEFQGENMLKGSDGAAYTHGDGKYYQLSSGDNGIGFYWGAEDGGEFINEPHKAYLLVPESDAAEYYPFDSEETNVYILGEVNGNDWAPNDGVRMEYNNDEGVYTATITADGRNEGYNYFGFTTELAENNDEGGWDYIEPFRLGATGEDDFLVTDECLGQELSLTWDDYHAFKIPEGEYTLTLDLDNLTLLIERKQSAPEDVYILGMVNGNWDDADVGVKMDYNASSGLYTATVTIGEKYCETEKDCEEFDGYIIFSNKLAENWNGWDEIESYLFGATGEDDFVMTNSLMGKNISLTYANPQWLQIPYGEYTLTLNLDNLTLVIRKKAVNDTVFILGNIDDNDWAANEGVQMHRCKENESGKAPGLANKIKDNRPGKDEDDDGSNCFEACITADGRDNGYNTFSFSTKLARDANDWDSIAPYRFGAVSQGDFLVTDKMFDKNLSLTYDNPQAFRIPKGEYYLYLDLDNLTLYIEDITSLPDVFILGEVNGNNWDPGEGVQMDYDDDRGLYTATITADGRNDGYNYFSFTTQLGDDWDDIVPYRFGAVSQGDFWVTSDLLGTEIALTYDNPQAFRIPEGEYLLTLDLDNRKLIIDAAVWSGQGGFCGNVNVNRGRNLYYEVNGEGEQRTLTIHKNPAAVGNDFSMADDPNLGSLEPAVLIIEDGVTTIGKSAFASCESLASVTIGSGVTTIGKSAFKDCNGLPSITIPDNVTTLGEGAFASCESLASVTIGSGVKTIGKSAFEYCENLPSITIPDNVTTIDDYAFHACRSLPSITIGSSVTTIGNSAFEYCTSMTSVTIPQSVTFIGNNAFYWCDAMEDVYCYALPNKLTWDEGGCDDFKLRWVTRCHVYDVSSWSSFESEVNVTFVEDIPVKLYDTADNTDLVGSLANKTKEVTLADHFIFADGSWNTLCLPFSFTSLTGTPLEGFTVKELDTSTRVNDHQTGLENGTLYLNFKDATSIEAGKPYIVKKEMGNANYVSCTADRGTRAATGLQDNTFDYRGLVDGSTGRRWRTNAPTASNPCYCEFHTADAVTMTNYRVAATNMKAETNPKVWTLYGKLNENDQWTVIDSRDAGANPGDALPIATTQRISISQPRTKAPTSTIVSR